MVKRSLLFKPLRIWLEHESSTSSKDAISTCLWWSFLTNSFHSSISMGPYEALYAGRCTSPIGWFEVGESSIRYPNFIYKTLKKVHIINNRLQTTYSQQKSYADNRRMDLQFEEGDKVCLKI